jgi:hypothetical protein
MIFLVVLRRELDAVSCCWRRSALLSLPAKIEGRLDHLAAGEPLSSLGESFRVGTVLSGGSVAVSVSIVVPAVVRIRGQPEPVPGRPADPVTAVATAFGESRREPVGELP